MRFLDQARRDIVYFDFSPGLGFQFADNIRDSNPVFIAGRMRETAEITHGLEMDALDDGDPCLGKPDNIA